MRRSTVSWSIYFLGIAFIVACLGYAMSAKSEVPPENDPLVRCFDEPPKCQYGSKLVCHEYKGEWRWYCTADHKVFRDNK